MHSRSFHVISNYNKTNLLCIYMFKVNNKSSKTRCETCLELKLKNKYTRKTIVLIVNFEHISYLVLVFLLLTLNI